MSTHTRGPWMWDSQPWDYDAEQEAPWLVTADDKQDRVLSGSVQCSEDDARLISAAPDLLEALQEALFLIQQECADGFHTTEAIRARAAIAKATGGAV